MKPSNKAIMVAATMLTILSLNAAPSIAAPEKTTDVTCGGQYITDYQEVFDKSPSCDNNTTTDKKTTNTTEEADSTIEQPGPNKTTETKKSKPTNDKPSSTSSAKPTKEETPSTKTSDKTTESNKTTTAKTSKEKPVEKEVDNSKLATTAAEVLTKYSAGDNVDDDTVQVLLALSLLDTKGEEQINGLSKVEKAKIAESIKTKTDRKTVESKSKEKPESLIKDIRTSLQDADMKADWDKLNSAAGGN